MDHGVLLVDDDDFTRMALTAVLASLHYDVVGQAATVAQAMDAARATRPTLAVVDLDLGEGPSGIDLAHGLRGLLPSIGLVMLSSYADPRFLGRRSRPLPEGAVFVTKQKLGDASVLRAALQRAYTFDSDTVDVVSDHGVAREAPVALSDTQIELMRLISAGLSNAEIARRMWITEAGVNRGVTRLVKQLGLVVTKDRNARMLIARAYADVAGRSVVHD